MNMHSSIGLIDLYHAITPSLKFEPKMHINACESIIDLKDELPRFSEMPKEMGGTGKMVGEKI